MATIVKCPACGKHVPWIESSLWRPFCSERCKITDLGDWAANRHVIPGSRPASDDDLPPADDQGSGRH